MLKITGTGGTAGAFAAESINRVRSQKQGASLAVAAIAMTIAGATGVSAQNQLPWKSQPSAQAYQDDAYNGRYRPSAAPYDSDNRRYNSDNRQGRQGGAGGYSGTTYPQRSGDVYNPSASDAPLIRQPSRDPYAQPPSRRDYGNQGSRDYPTQGAGGYRNQGTRDAPQPRRTYNNSPSYNSSQPYRQPGYQAPRYQEPAYQEPAYQAPTDQGRAYREPAYQPPAATQPYADSYNGDERAPDGSYSIDEITQAGHGFFGSISKGLASVIEHAFKRSGRPNGYILGEGAGGAFIAGLRYGEGRLYTKNAGTHRVYWQGPSVGYDAGAEGSKTMILVYNLRDPSEIYQRFGGIAGSAYLVGGVGITLQKRGRIVLAPIRAGVGLRLGANVGYLKYTRRPTWNPF